MRTTACHNTTTYRGHNEPTPCGHGRLSRRACLLPCTLVMYDDLSGCHKILTSQTHNTEHRALDELLRLFDVDSSLLFRVFGLFNAVFFVGLAVYLNFGLVVGFDAR